MGLLDVFKKKEICIASPMKGTCVSIKEVSDPTFGDEILGKGVAVKPVDGRVCAPEDGVVTTVFPTGHAVGITTKDEVELLIHVGIDTVKMDGRGFQIKCQDGQEVKKGDLLIEADLDLIRQEGYDTITPVVVCNSDDFSQIMKQTDGEVAAGDTILTLKK
ncbi:MAG: PTS glucose transporter subunit IIA [Lachnospiraceae bacterium]